MTQSKALAILKGGPRQLSPELAKKLAGRENITQKETVPSLTYDGKTWVIAVGGDRKKLQKPNDEGDMISIPTIRVAILDWAKRRGRAYYPGNYDAAKAQQPTCWSDDGKAAHSSVKADQVKTKGWNGKCEGCPLSIKGSKQGPGNEKYSACGQHRIITVLPYWGENFSEQPLRMKLSVTSDWDKDGPHEALGWYGFQQYMDLLRANGVVHSAQIGTKMKFDPDPTYPKVLFSVDQWFDDEKAGELIDLADSEEVKKLMTGFTPAGADGVATEEAEEVEQEDAPAPKATKKAAPPPADEDDEEEAPAPKATKKAAPPADEDDDGDAPFDMPVKATKKAAPPPADEDEEEAPAPKKATKKAAPPPDEDDEEEAPKPAKKATKKAAAPAISTDVPDDVAAILNDWPA